MIYKKKGSPNDCSKYRAIGLLNHAYKVMSVVLLRRLVEECKEFFSEWQAGFRAKRGCNQALVYLQEVIKQTHQQSKVCLITSLDFKKCYDKANKYNVIDKLASYTKSPRFAKLIYSFIEKRKIATLGHEKRSKFYTPMLGIPQGSKLSTLLFLILSLDLLDQVENPSKSVQHWKCPGRPCHRGLAD